MNAEGNILTGPQTNWELENLNESLSQFIFEKISSVPVEKITQINGDTDESMTHGQFLELTHRIGAGLTKLGITDGDIVILLSEHSHRSSAVATAAILLNVPIAPLDKNLKAFELRNMISSYKPKLIVCNQSQLSDMLKTLTDLNLDIPLVLLDKEKSESEKILGFSSIFADSWVPIEPKPVSDPSKAIAMVLPSSGSTGIPKGVALSHQSMVVLCKKLLSHPAGIAFQLSHFFWITGTISYISSLMGSVRVFLNDLSCENILRAVKKYQPTMIFTSPALLASLAHFDLKPDDLSSLKVIMTGGSHLNKSIVDELSKKLANPPIFTQSYGSTENCSAIAIPVPGTDLMSVGQVAPDVQIKIADPDTGAILGKGETGEICVKFPYQMLGYLNNDAATRDAYDQDGWLLTGDLGYFNEKGALYITGRRKILIKFRNMQISPEQIELFLKELPGVQDAAVDGIPHPEEYFHPIALVIKTAGATITEDDIHTAVNENLAPHNQLRAGVFFVDSLPRTVTGKVKRTELAALARKIHQESK